MSDVALSIVIPTFNTAAMTLATCRAALAASPPATEVIVVDDASSDGTSELLASSLPDVRVVRLATNQRFAAAANAGVTASRGAIVLLLNSDAVVERDALNALLAAFEREPRLGVAGAQLINGDGSPQWSGGRLPTLAWLFVLAGGFASLLPRRRRAISGGAVDWVSGAAMALRRSVWAAVGPLRESYRFYAQDLELCANARAAGWDVEIVEAARVVHAGGASVRQWRDVGELPHDPALLWLDLLTWGRRHHGRAWVATARVLMIVAATIRVITRPRSAPYAHALRQLFIERE